MRLLLAFALFGVLAAQQELTDVRGVIREVNARNGWYAIEREDDRGTRYAPDRLADEFKKDGLRVIFSGRVRPVDPAVRTWGTPLTLTSISLRSPVTSRLPTRPVGREHCVHPVVLPGRETVHARIVRVVHEVRDRVETRVGTSRTGIPARGAAICG